MEAHFRLEKLSCFLILGFCLSFFFFFFGEWILSFLVYIEARRLIINRPALKVSIAQFFELEETDGQTMYIIDQLVIIKQP